MSHRTRTEPRRGCAGATKVRSSGAAVAVISLAPGAVDAVGFAAGDRTRARRCVGAAEVGVEEPDVPLRPQLAHVRVEVRLRDDLDVEQHLRVVLPAQLGALATVVPDRVGNELELVP